MLNVLTTRLIINYWYLNLMFKNTSAFFCKDCFLLHPLCYIYMEVFTCCYLSIWDGDQKSMLALSRWICRCCVVWLFSLGFPSTFILKALSAILCIWTKIWKIQGAEIQQGQNRLLYCTISTNFLEKGYYIFGNDLVEIHANLCSYQDQVETEDLNVKVQLKS